MHADYSFQLTHVRIAHCLCHVGTELLNQTGRSMKKTKSIWLKSAQKHDYPAARAYLDLLLPPHKAKKIIDKLKASKVKKYAAKDLLRASNLPLLPADNKDVRKDRRLIAAKHALSPLLLCRDPEFRRLIIADGYHRLCAVYSFDEEALIHCQIV